jgi:hypothetical protein
MNLHHRTEEIVGWLDGHHPPGSGPGGEVTAVDVASFTLSGVRTMRALAAMNAIGSGLIDDAVTRHGASA